MLGSSELGDIPTFIVPEFLFHPGPSILLVEVGCFHPHATLLVWRCTMIGFEFLKAR